MRPKPVLKVFFLYLKTSQQRVIINHLRSKFHVRKTKHEPDILFVNELKEYDIKHKIIMPYNDIDFSTLIPIIENVVFLNKDAFKNVNFNKTKKIIEKPLKRPNKEVYNFFDKNLMDKLNQLKEKFLSKEDINLPKKTLDTNSIIPNNFFDEIYVINSLEEYDKWNNIKNQFIKNKIYVNRWEGKKLLYNSYLELFQHILTTEDEKILILQDDILLNENFGELFKKQVNNMKTWNFWTLGLFEPPHFSSYAFAVKKKVLKTLINVFKNNQGNTDINYLIKSSNLKPIQSFPPLIYHKSQNTDFLDKILLKQN